jgi:hypothetical protein
VTRILVVAACAGFTAAAASAQTTAVMHVGATVVPHCLFSVAPVAADAPARAVTASCGAPSLRALRASAGQRQLPPIGGRRLHAGGDAIFLISRDMAADGRTVVVTLDF